MRRTTPRTTVATTAVAAAALLLAGCGAQDDGKDPAGPARTTTTPAPATTASAPATTTAPATTASAPATTTNRPTPTTTTPAACTGHAELTTADSGRTLCLTTGGQLRLTLDGTKERPWAPVRATGNVLKGADAGIVILPGDALAAYTATGPGTARLTSTRPLCATAPGRMSCKGVQQWTVTVKVVPAP